MILSGGDEQSLGALQIVPGLSHVDGTLTAQNQVNLVIGVTVPVTGPHILHQEQILVGAKANRLAARTDFKQMLH